MKTLFYKLFALIFRLGRLRKVKPDRIVFLAPHQGEQSDSLASVQKALGAQGGYELLRIGTDALHSLSGALRFFTLDAIRLATARAVFLNDNFMPLADLTFAPETAVVQLWHAEGAFKKFGLDAPLPDAVRARAVACGQRYTHVICSSAQAAPIYSGAFGVPAARVYPLGAPRADALLAEQDLSALREAFDRRHPACRGKKLALYAPTFRDDPSANAALPTAIDAEALQAVFPDCALLIKLHPQIRTDAAFSNGENVTGEELTTLALLCDLLITDYSSVCMDFALLDKPCFFYAFDLDAYRTERNFYYDYESYVPGPVVRTQKALFSAMQSPETCAAARKRFRDFNFDYLDCRSTQRVIDAILNK